MSVSGIIGSHYVTLLASLTHVEFALKIRNSLNNIVATRQERLEERVSNGSWRARKELELLEAQWERFEDTREIIRKDSDLAKFKGNFDRGPFYLTPVEFRTKYADGTVIPRIEESIRDTDCYLVSGFDIPYEMLPDPVPELLRTDPKFRQEFLQIASLKATAQINTQSLIYAIKQSKVGRLNAIFAKLAGSRQEITKGKEPNLSRMFSESFGPITDSIMTFDLHDEATEASAGFDIGQLERLYGSRVLLPAVIKYAFGDNYNPETDRIASPDAGGLGRAKHYGTELGLPLIIGLKSRPWEIENAIDGFNLYGDVEGKRVALIDDINDTSGTGEKNIEALFEHGAAEVTFVYTHALHNGPAFERLDALHEKYGDRFRVITTNSVLHKGVLDYIKVIKLEDFIAEAIYDIHTSGSLSRLYSDLAHNPRLR